MNPDLTLPASLCFGYAVYGWRRRDRYLYIGKTNVLFTRFRDHHVIGIADDIDIGLDQIDVWLCTKTTIDVIETSLIRLHKPLYNGGWRPVKSNKKNKGVIKLVRVRWRKVMGPKRGH